MADKAAPKYDDLNNRYPGDFRAGEIILYSYGGSQLEISGMTAVVNVYQWPAASPAAQTARARGGRRARRGRRRSPRRGAAPQRRLRRARRR